MHSQKPSQLRTGLRIEVVHPSSARIRGSVWLLQENCVFGDCSKKKENKEWGEGLCL